MSGKKFRFVTVATKECPVPIVGYYCKDRVTMDDIRESDYIPEDIKAEPHIFNISQRDGRKVTIEPGKVIINFAGSLVVSKNIFGLILETFKEFDDKQYYLHIVKFQYGEQVNA